MILNINGRNMQITDSIRAHVEKKAAKLERFFRPDTEVQVRISQERGGRNIAEVTVALRGVILRAEEVTNEMYASIDTAITARSWKRACAQARSNRPRPRRLCRRTRWRKPPRSSCA